jgi:hypothetical protein
LRGDKGGCPIFFIFFLTFFLYIQPSFSQLKDTTLKDTSTTFKPKRFYAFLGGGTIIYGSSLYLLYQLWYADYPQSKFHYFNDNNEWYGMDKLGHGFTAYSESLTGIKALRWCGMKDKNAILLGGSLGLILQTPIEIMDGLSAEWGFSYGDMIANASGSVIAITQELIFKEQLIKPKIGFQRTIYPNYRPNLLGDGLAQEFIKDYNGQTYWLSLSIQEMTQIKKIPPYLALSLGYGIDGFIGAAANPTTDKNGNPYPYFYRNRLLYLSLDIDLEKIKTNNKRLKQTLAFLNFIKVPFPAIYLDKRGKLGAIPIGF